MVGARDLNELSQYDRLLDALSDPDSDSLGIADELVEVGNATGLTRSELAHFELGAFRQLADRLSIISNGTISTADGVRLERVALTLGIPPAEVPASSIPI